MTSFNFKLERVLNYKETVENLKKSKFAQARQKLIKEESILDEFFKHKKSLIEEKNLSSRKIKAGELALYNSYIDTINRRIENQRTIILRTREELDRAKEEMVDAVKEKRIFEKLKENQYEEFKYEQGKEEQKINDNLISYKTTTRN